MTDTKGYLIVYKHDTWREEIGRYNFYGKAAFQPWTDPQNDELSSFKFKLPPGWELRIHRHRDPGSQYKAWRGTGHEETVNKEEIPDFLHDEASSHSWVEL